MPFDHWQSCKEIIRHVLLRLNSQAVIDVIRRKRGRYTGHLNISHLDQVFSDIYQSRAWIEHEGQESLSGAGSTAAATQTIAIELSRFLKNTGCKRLVDIGCGDFNWMQNVDGDFEYLGIDIVPSLIEQNNAVHGNAKRRFICMDATKHPIEPWGEVVICREVLFHLSLANAKALLHHIKSAGFRGVLLTTDNSIWFNSDIRDGDFRRINLMRYPFNLPPPRLAFEDGMVSDGRVLALWSASAL
jgi:SAM-dependent methyltransferase